MLDISLKSESIENIDPISTELLLKFIYSEKATKFCEISTIDLSYPYVKPVKSSVEILQNVVSLSEYMNFTMGFNIT